MIAKGVITHQYDKSLWTKNLALLIIVSSVFPFFISGCRADTAHSHEQWLTAWLDEPTCALPCWEGSTPGVCTAGYPAMQEQR